MGTLTPVLMAAGTVLSAVGEIQAGQAAAAQGKAQQQIYDMQAANARAVAERNAQIAEDQSKYAAARDREQAGQEEAASQRAAKEKRRQTDIAISNVRAEAGASGAGVYDPTVLDIIGDVTEIGEYDALTSLYEGKSAASILRSKAALSEYEGRTQAGMIRYGGETNAQLLTYQGETARYEGNLAKQQSYMKAASTAIGGGANIASKYAPAKLNSGYIPGQSSRYYISDNEYIDWNK